MKLNKAEKVIILLTAAFIIVLGSYEMLARGSTDDYTVRTVTGDGGELVMVGGDAGRLEAGTPEPTVEADGAEPAADTGGDTGEDADTGAGGDTGADADTGDGAGTGDSGALGLPDQTQGDGAVSYPVNINTATAEELTALPGIGEVTALRIIEYRQENGDFEHISDIMDVSGVGKKTYENIMELIVTG